MTGHDASRLVPLPIRPRPAAGEPVSSYVRRLARANHLRPSYLHGYLAGPPDYLRAISPERLAVLSGRTVAVLERTLTGLTRPDAMLEANPEVATAAIWQHLADERGTTIAYPTLRTYVASRRAGQRLPGQKRSRPAGTGREPRTSRRNDMARISYDDQTAAAFKAVREVPRDGLAQWREAVRRHLHPSPGMTVADIGAGTGAFAAAFSDWFGLTILAVEPSAAMRAQIPRRPGIQALEGDASALPLPDDSADGAWLSLMIHHIPDLEAAAREIRRVLRPGAPVLIRQGFPGRVNRNEFVRWFPETTRTVDTYPTVEQTCQAFAAAGFSRDSLEPIPETYRTSLAEFLAQADTFRRADTTMRNLTEEEFLRGKERLRRAAQDAGQTANLEPRTSWLDLLVLR